MPIHTIEETVALSLGKDPRWVNWDNVRSQVQISTFASAYQARRDIILRAKLAGQLWDSTIPGVFIAWAKRMNVDLPSQLVDAVTDLGVQVADWKSAYENQRHLAEQAKSELLAEKRESIQRTADHTAYIKKMGNDYREVLTSYQTKIAALQNAARTETSPLSASSTSKPDATEKALGTRERESLLKLVIGMAVGAYRYKPNASRSEVISEVASDLEAAGVALDVDTVRKYIREARDLLPPVETDQKP